MAGKTGGTYYRESLVNETVMFESKHAKEIIDYLNSHFKKNEIKTCLDAFSGTGVLGKALEDRFKKSRVDYAEIAHGQDVYDITKKYDLIIANPWWSLKHSLKAFNFLQERLTKKGILIFIINNVFCYQGSDRGESLNYQKYYFLPRWTFETSGRPLLDCGIMIYHKNGIVPKEAAALKPFIKLSRFPVKEFVLKEGFDIITEDGERDIEIIEHKIKARSIEHALKKFL